MSTSLQSGLGDAGIAALPPEVPLPMPEQSLWSRPDRSSAPGDAAASTSGSVAARRVALFTAVAGLTVAAADEMYKVLEVAGLTVPEAVLLVLFVSLFAWIALSFVSSLIGFVSLLAGPDRGLGIDPDAPRPVLASRTAMLLPTYNEEPRRTMARLQAIHDSVAATGQGAHFDYFVLSDSTNPATWIAEEAAWLELRAATGSARIFYRHRTRNIGRKAGNIAEWVSRFGGAYDHMIVLDADSLMEGDTVVRLAGAMERNPRVGLIQTLPVLLNGDTPFARIQQFAGRVYGPLIARGIAWWHGSESNYWGHNAIIRVAAFAAQAGLPLLGGRKPFGGHIMSHDFVEAALLRRGGWGVHIVPSIGGSYEECPPTLADYAARDRRWCQGNLQHLGVLPARGLHWMSRLHLLTGIGSYVAAPLWLMFLLTGILISLQAQYIRPDYFPAGATLFPQWPAQDPVRAAWVFAGAMGMLVLPKLLGYVAMALRRHDRRAMGGALRGLASVLLETAISALTAPVMMLTQSRAVAEILLGRDAGWTAQRREGGPASLPDLARFYATPTLLGLALALAASAVSGSLVLWMSAVIAGLALAIPTGFVTSHPGLGHGLRRLGLLLTAEEMAPPDVLMRAGAIAGRGDAIAPDPVSRLARDRALLKAHLDILPPPPPRRPGDVDVDLVLARARMDDARSRAEAVSLLSPRELFAVLSDRSALLRLMAMPPRADDNAGKTGDGAAGE